MRENYHPEIRLGRHRTDLIHTHAIRSISTKELNAFNISDINKQVCYVKLDFYLKALFDDHFEFIVEIEN